MVIWSLSLGAYGMSADKLNAACSRATRSPVAVESLAPLAAAIEMLHVRTPDHSGTGRKTYAPFAFTSWTGGRL